MFWLEAMGLLLLTIAVIMLPIVEMKGYLVNEPMNWGAAITWWILFGGGVSYIWVHWLRGRWSK